MRHDIARLARLSLPGALVLAAPAAALQPVADLRLDTMATSNVYFDASQEWDLALRPSLGLGLDFAEVWSAGYTGELSAYLQHTQLLSHWHELYLFYNPAWGDDGENQLVVELRAETLRNDDAYAAINYLRPTLLTKLILEPVSWWSLALNLDTSYRWFYDDAPSDSVDVWAGASTTFTLPTRTTLAPRLRYGFRYYPRQDLAATQDQIDQQLEVGAHLSQGLWSTAGLQLDYRYLWAIGQSGLLERKLSADQFAYLGEEFFYSGHRGAVELKQLLGDGRVGVSFAAEDRTYHGWPALDADGALTGEDRHDVLLVPRVYAGYTWWPGEETSRWIPSLGGQLDYAYQHRLSNSDWYATYAHLALLTLFASW